MELKLQGKASGWIVGIALALPLCLSCFSGYRHSALPRDILWDITPLGLLTGIRPEFFTYGTSCDFEGKFSFALDYLWMFLKTVGLELPFYGLALRAFYQRDRRTAFLRHGTTVALVGNLLTHPFIFFFAQCLVSSFLVFLFGAECFAASVETGLVAWVLSKEGKSVRPSGWIILGNLFSWQVGPFV